MRLRHGPDSETVTATIRSEVARWRTLDDRERDVLVDATTWLLRRKRWEGAGGLDLDDGIRTVIAAQAGLLVLELGTDHYREVASIVVYPSSMVATGLRAGPVAGTVTSGPLPIHGLSAGQRGPVLVAWDQARAAARHPGWGTDVVAHEFAHKLDQLDGLMDGTPPLPRADRDRWIRVCQALLDEMRRGVPHPPLRGYAAVNPSEFFAVATEAFFGAPAVLRQAEPELYAVLQSFYRQDPATRTWRAA